MADAVGGAPTPAARLKDLRARFAFRFRKSLSQHFLVDPRALAGIAGAVGAGAGDAVVEVGPGAGFLTERLLAAGAAVTAVEIDPGMIALLRHVTGFAPRLTIVEGDILRVDLAALATAAGTDRVAIAGNLPYHITTPVLFHLLAARDRITRLVLMVQREVGARMVAGPGTKTYGALSVAVAYATRCERLFDVGAGAFVPRPAVASTVLRLEPRPRKLEPAAEARLFALVRAAFGQRRKQLVNAVAETAGGREPARAWLGRCGIDGARRGETLTLAEFEALALAGG